VGHGQTVWLLQVNTQARCELEERGSNLEDGIVL